MLSLLRASRLQVIATSTGVTRLCYIMHDITVTRRGAIGRNDLQSEQDYVFLGSKIDLCGWPPQTRGLRGSTEDMVLFAM